MAELSITLSDGRTVVHKLERVVQILGRDPICDIVIDDPSTSRQHARFIPTPDGFVVEDLGSKNGTLVNGEPCASHLLQDGDHLLVGSLHCEYLTSAPTSRSVVVADSDTTTHATRYVSSDRDVFLPQQRLQVIYDLSARLTADKDVRGLLDDVLSICFEMLQFERGAVGVRRPGQRTMDWPAVRHLRGQEGELTISRTILSRALDHGERAIFSEGDALSADPSLSIVQQGIRSAMCVPLMHEDEVLGVIYGDRISSAGVYTAEDIDFLAAIGRQVSIGLVNCRLLEDQKRMLRLSHDVDVARTIQQGLFPRDLPNRANLTVAALNDPGRRVSGDYYDVIDAGEGRVWLLIADVSGEGMPAALLMANLQAAVHVSTEDHDDPGELLTRWNRLICANTDSTKFITCVLALIAPESGEIRFANAGHHSPLILTGPGNEPSELTGDRSFPLGIVEGTRYATTTVTPVDGPFMFFVYTDGVIEALNEANEQFDMSRMLRLLRDTADLPPAQLIKGMRRAVADFAGAEPQSDDITMLAARIG